jgi:hypothetical protein
VRNWERVLSFILLTGSFVAFIEAFIASQSKEIAEAAYFMGLSISLQIGSWHTEKTTVTVNVNREKKDD